MITYRQPFVGDYPITQRYGEVIPGVTKNGKPHTGIDYACPDGTPVLASADGIVMKAGWDSTGYGNCVIILHAAHCSTLYAHLSECAVYDNQRVRQGDVIGWSGYTGNVVPLGIKGAHLHFEARERWNDWTTHFDPMTLPLMSVDDNVSSREDSSELKEADSFTKGELLEVRNPLGVKAFFDKSFREYSTYPQNTKFYYTGDSTVRKDNGLTYMRVVPAMASAWVAVNDGEIQLLDKAE